MWSQGSSVTVDLDRMKPPNVRDWSTAETDAGGQAPSHFFALIESVLAHRAGRSSDEQRRFLGGLLAPFTEAAARRPAVSWFPTPRSAEEISGVRPDNRLVAEPYTKLMCSFPTVDLAAAVLVCSTELADRLGVAEGRRVHPWAVTAVKDDRPPSRWEEIDRSAGLRSAVDHVLTATGLDVDRLGAFDLYSCFPAAVQLALAALEVDAEDPRPFSLTGGLPYLGGPGASYSLHGVVAMVEQCRTESDLVGAVVGIGGMANDVSVGLYATAPSSAPFPAADPVSPSEAGAPSVPVVATGSGPAVVEAMTVVHSSGTGADGAPVVARLPTGERVGARPESDALVADLVGTSLVGREVLLTAHDGHTTYTPA